MNRSILLTGIALAIALAAPAPAQATDEKTLASSVCQGTFPSDRNRAYYYTTELRAVGGEVQMNCGLVRDSIDKELLWVDVRFDKKSGNDVHIPARVYSCNAAFHECSWKTNPNGGVSAGAGQRSFFVDTQSLPHSDTHGRYFSVWMRLPEGDWLMNLTSKEGD